MRQGAEKVMQLLPQQQRSKKREVNHVELIIRNKNGDEVFRIDKDGNLSMKGEIVAQGR